jgi:hypothetical protein
LQIPNFSYSTASSSCSPQSSRRLAKPNQPDSTRFSWLTVIVNENENENAKLDQIPTEMCERMLVGSFNAP